MSKLQDYIIAHTVCIQNSQFINNEEKSLVADLIFFKIKLSNNPRTEELKGLVKEYQSNNDSIRCTFKEGVLHLFNPFDGEEHSYIELGGWLGHQHLALSFIGLCCLLNIATLLTPDTVMPPNSIDESMRLKMAGMGLITMMAKK